MSGLPESLRSRQSRLQKDFTRLSGGYVFVKGEVDLTHSGNPFAILTASVRIREASIRLKYWEHFVDIDTEPTLYGFSYHVCPDEDVAGANPYFRYECHPDVGTEDKDEGEDSEREIYHSPYSTVPHFHPDNAKEHPIAKLHFPFHRSERRGIIFALVAWIHQDLLKRFYPCERFNIEGLGEM